MSDLKAIHKQPYPAISTALPALSQVGRTVLITGASSGIGFAIAKAFVAASASTVIILGRNPASLAAAVEQIAQEQPGYQTKVLTRECDITDPANVARLWNGLDQDGCAVDVLVLNAAWIPRSSTIVELGVDEVWQGYELNVRANLDFTVRFLKQDGGARKGTKALVNISTAAIQSTAYPPNLSAYSTTKLAFTNLLQYIAHETPADKVQIVSFHPGAIYTNAARSSGFTVDWDDEQLPGHFAVWAASPEAAFLHGRFVWPHWGVEKLKSPEFLERLNDKYEYLKIGVLGL